MINSVKKIMSMTFENAKSEENVMLLLSTYSNLYLNGQAPGWCEACMRDYYKKIITNGLERAKQIMEAKLRTLIPNWVGIRYVSGAFYDSETITDAQAISSIQKGYLREQDFKKLPEGLIKSEIDSKAEPIVKTQRRRK